MDNVDNMDNMDTDGRRVEAIPHGQEKQTTPNIDNVDNRTQTRPPLCARICPVVCPYLQRTPKPPPAPNRGIFIDKRPAEGVQLSRPPDMNDTDNEGKASTDEKKTDHDTDKYRQRGQPPAALRLYTTHKNGRPLRIENGRNITTSKYGQPQTAACKYTPIYLHAAKIRKAAHKTESQRSKEKRPAEGV